MRAIYSVCEGEWNEAKANVVAQDTRSLPMLYRKSASRLSHSSAITVSGHAWLFWKSFESRMDDEDTAQDRVAGSGPEKSFAEPREEAQRRDQRGSAGRTTSQGVAQAQLVVHDTSSIVLFKVSRGWCIHHPIRVAGLWRQPCPDRRRFGLGIQCSALSTWTVKLLHNTLQVPDRSESRLFECYHQIEEPCNNTLGRPEASAYRRLCLSLTSITLKPCVNVLQPAVGVSAVLGSLSRQGVQVLRAVVGLSRLNSS